jgi:8-oxo-dGTP pyrophosphatase MutT (NUDIX family)
VTIPVWQQPDLLARLAADLRRTPVDAQWRRQWAPELSYGRHAGPARGDARPAAVAVVLCRDGESWSVPLTVRCASLTRHGGQVSLPGGLSEPGESMAETATRELIEELGVHVELTAVGELSPLFVFASNAVVTPWIAAIDHWPEWIPHPPEVDRVLRLELTDLVWQQPGESIIITRGPLQFSAPRMEVDGEAAWGATAAILGELRGRLLRLNVSESPRLGRGTDH